MIRLKTLEDVQKLIDGKIKESLTLDYKGELGRNEEIAKDISAFANTSGGVIVYGIIEKDNLPVSINWIESKGVRERIENVLISRIQPNIEEYEINSIENPSDPSKAIFTVHVPQSLNAPHMVNHRYYKRYKFQSPPMEDHEVKEAIFKKGLREALNFEVSRNLELANKTLKLIEGIYRFPPEKRKHIVFTPFYTEAWKVIIGSGLLPLLKEKTIKFIKAYNIVHEVNHLIDCQKYGLEVVVTPSYKETSPEHGTYIPAIVQAKVQELYGILNELKEDER